MFVLTMKRVLFVAALALLALFAFQSATGLQMAVIGEEIAAAGYRSLGDDNAIDGNGYRSLNSNTVAAAGYRSLGDDNTIDAAGFRSLGDNNTIAAAGFRSLSDDNTINSRWSVGAG